ncbi:MAG: LexA family transcriptional regulator, partial [Oscillospiraceae bacterium]|nr:LexA family transcriptional regulator [Oscillospiraceae bacterium]
GTAPVVRYDAAKEKAENIVGRRIAEARRAKGLSIAAFSEYLESFGVKITTGGAGKWETGYSIPNAYQMIAICNALEIEDQIPFFMGDHTPVLNDAGIRKVQEYRADLIASGRYRPAPKNTSIITYVSMPISHLCVSAGTGAFLDEGNFEMLDFPADKVPEGADFGVRVSGDSMEPTYHDGQIVWVHECESLSPGEVGVFIYDGEGFIKLYGEREPDEGTEEAYTDSYGAVHAQPVLLSYNPAYEPRAVRPDALFRVVGRVL